MDRSRRFVAVYIGIQIAIPIAVYLLRVTTAPADCLRFGWHMYSCIPG